LGIAAAARSYAVLTAAVVAAQTDAASATESDSLTAPACEVVAGRIPMVGVVVPEIVIGEVTEIEVTLEVLTAFKMRP
jgi:hypothetical protein